MARWVLPVLVGPSTAVTPTPRARTSRLWGAEKVTGIKDRQETFVVVDRMPAPLRVATLHAQFSGLWCLGCVSRIIQSVSSGRVDRFRCRTVFPAGTLRWVRDTFASVLKHPGARFCTTMRQRTDAGLTSGTSLERIAAESLTPAFSDFVHCQIWQ
jgi:hypothetical protein